MHHGKLLLSMKMERWIFRGIAPVSNELKRVAQEAAASWGPADHWRTSVPDIPCQVASQQSLDSVSPGNIMLIDPADAFKFPLDTGVHASKIQSAAWTYARGTL